MAVPSRPSAGGVVESAWGQVAHDTAVAQDIQAGVATIASFASGSGFVAVTFARPFASAPAVVCTAPGNTFLIAQVGLISTTGFTAYIRDARDAGTASGSNVFVNWIAYGPRA